MTTTSCNSAEVVEVFWGKILSAYYISHSQYDEYKAEGDKAKQATSRVKT